MRMVPSVFMAATKACSVMFTAMHGMKRDNIRNIYFMNEFESNLKDIQRDSGNSQRHSE